MIYLLFYILSVVVSYHIFLLITIQDKRDGCDIGKEAPYVLFIMATIPLLNIFLMLLSFIYVISKYDMCRKFCIIIQHMFLKYQNLVEKLVYGDSHESNS